jgi:predicted MFS family arabinose efflux permease
VTVAGRLFRLAFGEDVEPELRPVLAVTFAGTLAGSALWTYMGIWAVSGLHEKALLPFVLLVGAVVSGVADYGGGWLSDRFGRRRVMVGGQALFVLYPLLLLGISGHPELAVCALALAGLLGSLGGSVAQAMVADLVPPDRTERAYASVRVALNVGVVIGPPIAAVLLGVGGWSLLFVCVSAMSAVAWLAAYFLLPRRGAYAPEHAPERSALDVILRDRPFLLFLGSAVFAWIVYAAYEVVLPVAIVNGFGYNRTVWGALVWINPFLVTLLQVRLTSATARIAPAVRLTTAMLIMGLPFLVLTVNHSLPALVFVVTAFVFGEMLWIPTSQTVVAELAPPDIRGAYMGAFGAGPAIGFALGPLIGLQARNSFGDAFTWTMFPVIAVVAAVLGGLALRIVHGHRGPATSENASA